MGLDTVELVMEVEEEFDVTIPDEEAEKLRTVGDLYCWIAERIGALGIGVCPSSATSYRLRRALIRQRRIERRMIRLETATSDLIVDPDSRFVYFPQSVTVGVVELSNIGR
jgi:hypothetical protein